MKTIVSTDQAPQAVGPYSQAVKSGGFVFVSGQVAIDPATQELKTDLDVRDQTRLVLDNVKAVLEAAGSSLDQVVKASVFVKNMDDFGTVNEVYATYFENEPPARECIEAARLPKDFLVEISVIAVE